MLILNIPSTEIFYQRPLWDLVLYVSSQQTQNICITFIQCWTSVGDVGPTLYKWYTNVLSLLWFVFMKHTTLAGAWCGYWVICFVTWTFTIVFVVMDPRCLWGESEGLILTQHNTNTNSQQTRKMFAIARIHVSNKKNGNIANRKLFVWPIIFVERWIICIHFIFL